MTKRGGATPSQHQPEAARPAGRKIAITNVRLLDGQQLRPGATVVIDGGRIGADPAGLRADLVLIDGDPLADIRASLSVRLVWCDGIGVDTYLREGGN